MSSASAPIAAAQPSAAGRASRTASPAGPASSRVCGLALPCSSRIPAPRSRPPARYTDRPPRTAANAAIGSSASGRGPVRGCSSSTQPSGVAQRSQRGPCQSLRSSGSRRRLRAPRRRSRPPGGGCPPAWLARAPAARNITAGATAATEKNSAGPAGMPIFGSRPATTVITAVSAHSTAAPAASPASAWRTAPRRVVCPASSNSHRPASSSPRSSFVPVSSPHTAPARVRNIRLFHAV